MWEVHRAQHLTTLDLPDEAAHQTVRDLGGWADVVIENVRPGRLESWGLGWADLHALNLRVMMVRVTGFRQARPLSREPGFGTLAEALSGFAAMTAGPAREPPDSRKLPNARTSGWGRRTGLGCAQQVPARFLCGPS